MILWIHGFASCGLSTKSAMLRDFFGEDRLLTPDLPNHPTAAIAHLEQLLREHPIEAMIGSSLGGYFATWLQREHPLPTVLINPAVAPFLLLEDYLGTHRDCHGNPFEVTTETLELLRSLHRERLDPRERYLVLLATGDEVIDYRIALDYYRNQNLILHPGGNHRFENLRDYLPRIEKWLTLHVQETQTTT